MQRNILLLLATSAVIAFPTLAAAQVNCETIPPGPARTDCYITLSRIGGQNAAIAASKARVQADKARLRQVTGASAPAKPRNQEYLRVVPAN